MAPLSLVEAAALVDLAISLEKTSPSAAFTIVTSKASREYVIMEVMRDQYSVTDLKERSTICISTWIEQAIPQLSVLQELLSQYQKSLHALKSQVLDDMINMFHQSDPIWQKLNVGEEAKQSGDQAGGIS